MTDIVKELNEKNLGNTTKEKKWKRNCPKCNKLLYYDRKWTRDFFNKNQRLCNSCVKIKYDIKPPYIRQCPKCGKNKIYKDKHGLINAIKKNALCGSCHQVGERNHNFGLYYKDNKKWRGFEDLTGRYWGSVLRGAKLRNLPITISIKDAWNQFIKQNKKCALSGIELKLEIKRNDGNASLDRIDSSLGYIQGNIQWIDKKVNGMKSNMEEKEFVKWCKLISGYRVS